MARTFHSTAEVAETLGMSRAGFLRVRPRLENQLGFPEPMPHCKRPMLWRADQVDVWVETRGLPKDVENMVDPADIASGRVALLAEARKA